MKEGGGQGDDSVDAGGGMDRACRTAHPCLREGVRNVQTPLFTCDVARSMLVAALQAEVAA